VGRARCQLAGRRRGQDAEHRRRRVQRPAAACLNRLALELDERDLDIARFWLEHVDDAGYLDDSAGVLALLAAARFDVPPSHAEIVRQRIVRRPGRAGRVRPARMPARPAAGLPAPAPGRPLALRVVDQCLALLGDHDLAAIAARLDAEPEQVEDAIALVLSLQPRPGEACCRTPRPTSCPMSWPGMPTAPGRWR
jgi:RNA polymerase sigma-54 factor